MPGAKVRLIESYNETVDAKDSKKIDASGDILALRGVTMQIGYARDDQDWIIDVGASNIKDVLQEFTLMNSAFDIDYFIVPTTVDPKQQTDTIKTIGELHEIGVNPAKILVIVNAVQKPALLNTQLENLYKVAGEGHFTLVTVSLLYNDAFKQVAKLDATIYEIDADPVNYSDLAREETDEDKRYQLGLKSVTQRLSKHAAKNLRAVWAATGIPSRVASAA